MESDDVIRTIHGDEVPAGELAHIAEAFRPFAMRIDALRRDPKNARRHGEDDLPTTAASLREFGQRKPIEFDPKTKVIAVGNGRHEAAETILGWEWIAAVPLDLTPEKLKAYALADNRTAEKSSWDMDRLAEALDELHADGALDFDLGDIGFGESDLSEIADLVDDQQGKGDAEEKTEQKSKATTYVISITCGGERHQRQLLAAIEALDGAKLVKAFKNVEVKAMGA